MSAVSALSAGGAESSVEGALSAGVGGVPVAAIVLAGSFGHEHYDVSMAMAEVSLLPAVRKAAAATSIAADGFSCRHQIKDGSGREARHVACILRDALAGRLPT